MVGVNVPFEGHTGRLVLLVLAPSDSTVYRCFSKLAHEWKALLTAERLWIEGEVPITPGLTRDGPPRTVAKLIEADLGIFVRLELEFAGLRVSYLRSGRGGEPQHRGGYFDEIRLELHGVCPLLPRELSTLLKAICECLTAHVATGTSDFVNAARELPILIREDYSASRTMN